MLQVSPTSTPVWPIAGDAPDLETIVADQAATIAANEALLHAYQGNLNAAQNPPPGTAATGTGTTSGASTNVSVNGVVGVIAVGATVTDGALVPAGTKVLGQISGPTGGSGNYLLNAAVNLGTATTLTFTPPSAPTTWPGPNDAPTLLLIMQQQTALIRNQSASLQHYVDLLNTSQTAAPPTGP